MGEFEMSDVPPMLLSAIICDRVIFDRITNMPSIINIIQNINSPKFPLRQSSLVFFCELTNGHGTTQAKVRLIDGEDAEHVLFEKSGSLEFSSVKQILSLALNMQGIIFPKPGEYRFQLFANDSFLGERRVICRKVDVNRKNK